MTSPEQVIALLRQRQLGLATCESLTGGLLSAALTAVPGASAVFRGGMVTYASDLKAAWVGADAAHIAAHGVINAAVAEQMAEGVRARAETDLGLACTGVAGPDPQDGAEPGTVFVALAISGQRTRVTQLCLEGDRGRVRAQTVAACLQLVAEALG